MIKKTCFRYYHDQILSDGEDAWPNNRSVVNYFENGVANIAA